MNTAQSTTLSDSGDAVRETAALWHDRLKHEKVTEDTQAGFQAWLGQSSENHAAYQAVERTWEMLQTQPHHLQILALRHEAALRLTRHSSLRRITPFRAAAAVLLFLGAGAGLLAWRSSDLTTLQSAVRLPAQIIEKLHGGEHYVTATGERLTVALTDGSQVTLNTQSELKVAFEPGERKVTLTRGQALFEVAKDKTRPFVVEAQGRRFIAVGTAFDVRIDPDRVQITMIEGTVKVEQKRAAGTKSHAAAEERTTTALSPKSKDKNPPDTSEILLTAGQQFTVAVSQSLESVRKANAERVTSWRLGQVIFEDSRLADAVGEINRYSKVQITLADPSLENLRISGAFLTGRPGNFVEALTDYFPIQAKRHPDGSIVLTAR